MKQLITLVALATITSASWAFSPTVVKSSVMGAEILQSPERVTDSFAQERSSEVEYHDVNPVFLIPEDSQITAHPFQYACTPDGREVYTRWEDYGFLMVPWSIPTGVYDFLFVFDSPEGKLFVAKYNMVVNGDMEIEVNPEEAFVNHIQWSPCLPDGTLPQYSETNISTGCSAITHEGVGAPLELFIFEVAAKETDDGFRDFQKEANFWINDGTKYSAGQTMHVAKDGVQYHILLPAQGMATQTVTNPRDGFSSYKLAEPDRWNDIIGESSPLTYPNFGFEWSWGNDFVLGYSEFLAAPGEKNFSEIKYCMASTVPGWEFGVKPSMKIMASEVDGTIFGIELPPMIINGDSNEFYTMHSCQSPCDYFIGAYRYNEEGKRPYVLNPQFALPENATPIFGDAAPIVVFTRPNVEFGYSYVGRYGEIRSCDYLGQTFSIKNNGVEVWNDYFNMNDFYWTEDWEPGPAYNSGSWDYDMSASKLTVDGLKASTSCTMHFENENNGSWPTLTAMQFRTTDNSISDRFISPADGVLRFSGGEWSYSGLAYECVAPESITVEYAPYGSQDFSALNYNEVPSLRFMPGFGDYYEVPLEQVNRSSETKWYGLRFTIVDHEGNSQIQTVTPAFRIEDQSTMGISVPSSFSGGEVRVVGNTIYAPEGSRIFNLMGEPTDGISVECGIYVVVHGEQTCKVMVR